MADLNQIKKDGPLGVQAVIWDLESKLAAAQAGYTALRLRAEAAEAAACRMREALTTTFAELQSVQAAAALGGLSPRCYAGFGGTAKQALASAAPCPHAAEVERLLKLCGEAAPYVAGKKHRVFINDPEASKLEMELKIAAAKGGK